MSLGIWTCAGCDTKRTKHNGRFEFAAMAYDEACYRAVLRENCTSRHIIALLDLLDRADAQFEAGKGLTSYRLAAVQDEGTWRDEDAALIAAAPEALALLLDVAEAAQTLSLACQRWPEKVALPRDYPTCGDCDACRFNAALARLEAPDG